MGIGDFTGRKGMKKRLCILLALCTATGLLFTGCGGNSQQSETKPSEEKENAGSDDAENTDKEEEQEKKTEAAKITFWDMMWGEAGVYDIAAEALVDRYNQENPDVVVEYQSVPWDNYYQTFLTAITSGTGPDVATAGSQTPMQFATMGEIMPLTPIVEKWQSEKDPILDDMMEGILETNKLDNDYIALPWQCDTRAFTYRTDMFQEAGIETLPTTWDELLDVLRTLKEKNPDVFPLVTAGDLGGAQNLMMLLTVGNGVGPVTADGKSDFTSPKIQECLEFVAALMDEELIPEATISYKDADAQKLFYSGQAAVFYGGPVTGFFDDENLKDNLSILDPIQGPSAEKPQTVYWANSIAAYNKDSENSQAILNFVEWWVKNSRTLFTEGKCGKTPVLKSITEDSYYDSAVLEKLVNEKIMPTFVHATEPIQNFYPAFGQINGERYLGNAAQKVLSGRRDYQAVLEEDNKNVEAALELQAE